MMTFNEQRAAYFKFVVSYMEYHYPEETRAMQRGRNEGDTARTEENAKGVSNTDCAAR